MPVEATAGARRRGGSTSWVEHRREFYRKQVELLRRLCPRQKPMFVLARSLGVSVKLVREVLAGRR